MKIDISKLKTVDFLDIKWCDAKNIKVIVYGDEGQKLCYTFKGIEEMLADDYVTSLSDTIMGDMVVYQMIVDDCIVYSDSETEYHDWFTEISTAYWEERVEDFRKSESWPIRPEKVEII